MEALPDASAPGPDRVVLAPGACFAFSPGCFLHPFIITPGPIGCCADLRLVAAVGFIGQAMFGYTRPIVQFTCGLLAATGCGLLTNVVGAQAAIPLEISEQKIQPLLGALRAVFFMRPAEEAPRCRMVTL